MLTNRRNWLKTLGLVSAGLCLPRMDTLAAALTAVPEAGTGTADEPVRLCFNENPYGPPPSALEAMKKQIATSNRYPWDLIRSLLSAIALKNGLPDDHVLAGAGSTQIIDTVVQLAAQQKGSFVLATPTFDRWAAAAEQAGLEKIAVPLTAAKQHDLPAMLRAIKPDTRLVYICNPNNPTGTICSHTALAAFIREVSKQCLVMVDEAYLDYTAEQSLAALVKEQENLVVAKTFSKIYGLAGARIGYALAHAKTIERLQQLQSGADMGISAVSLAAAAAALKDDDFVRRSAALNQQSRKTTTDALEQMGLPCIVSHTNFIYLSLIHYKDDFFGRLKAANIQGTGIFEETGRWTRITVGTDEEMQRFMTAIQKG